MNNEKLENILKKYNITKEELEILYTLTRKMEKSCIDEAKKINKLKHDPEEYHIIWDEFVYNLLYDAGFKQIAKMYNNAPCFWYS